MAFIFLNTDGEKMKDYNEIYQKIGYVFEEETLLTTALTHPSCNVKGMEEEDNQRMEFLGDAVLELIISDLLYREYDEDEGKLTRMRSALVNEDIFAKKAVEIKLDKYIRLNHGEEATGGRQRKSNLADCFEAVMGAVYLDGGYAAAFEVISQLFDNEFDEVDQKDIFMNYKSILQEYTQKNHLPLPAYRVIKTQGKPHNHIFFIELRVNGEHIASAKATSKKEAEKAAAKQALQKLGII